MPPPDSLRCRATRAPFTVPFIDPGPSTLLCGSVTKDNSFPIPFGRKLLCMEPSTASLVASVAAVPFISRFTHWLLTALTSGKRYASYSSSRSAAGKAGKPALPKMARQEPPNSAFDSPIEPVKQAVFEHADAVLRFA